MVRIREERFTADIEGDFVLFLIGMRINTFWKVHKWLPVFRAMPRMLEELSAQKQLGLLGFRARWGLRNVEVVQYWRSFEQLHAYAHNPDTAHLPAWGNFNRKIETGGAVGIWHEVYLIKAGQYESVYRNMPLYGLAAATTAIPATGERKTALGRLGRTADDETPVEEPDGR